MPIIYFGVRFKSLQKVCVFIFLCMVFLCRKEADVWMLDGDAGCALFFCALCFWSKQKGCFNLYQINFRFR